MNIAIVMADDSTNQEVASCIKSLKEAGFDRLYSFTKQRFGVQAIVDSSVKIVKSIDQIPHEMYDNIVIMDCTTVPADFLSVLEKKMELYSSSNYAICLSGWTILSLDSESRFLPTSKAVKYDRMPRSERYSMNDSGDVVVHFMKTNLVAMKGYTVSDLVSRNGAQAVNDAIDDCLKMSVLLNNDDGYRRIPIVCIDVPDKWGRPLKSKYANTMYIRFPGTKLSSLTTHRWPAINNATPPSAIPNKNERLRKREELQKAYRPSPKPDSPEEKDRDPDLPILSVVFQTHNRTATACFCLDALCKNIEYGGAIHYCICDDRSYKGHIGALVSVLRDNDVKSFSVHTTSSDRWGLGTSMNNGLDWSFKFTDTVLTIEDDFLLRKRFNITKYVKELLKPDVAGIKLAANSERFNPVVECGHPGFKKVTADRKVLMSQRYTFNNLVMLRHKRVFDEIGKYAENVLPDVMEVDALIRFNNAFDNGHSDRLKVLWPTNLRLNTYDTEWFVHIGKSTLGHTSGIDTAKPYEYLADEELNRKCVDYSRRFFSSDIHLIIPCYNNPDLLDRCLRSVKSQKNPPKTLVTVVDDCSDKDMSIKIADVVCKYDFTVFMPLHDKKMAGGARNAALRLSPVVAPYTMFLDSDDEFENENALKNVADALVKNGNPDMLCLSYVFKNKLHMATSVSPTKSCAIAPWSRCVKTKLVKEFVENRRVCNDTIQYLRTLDSVSTVASIEEPIVRYNTDNKYSGWHSGSVKTSRACLEGMCLTMLDILFEKIDRATTKEAALSKLLYIENEFNKSLNALKEDILK